MFLKRCVVGVLVGVLLLSSPGFAADHVRGSRPAPPPSPPPSGTREARAYRALTTSLAGRRSKASCYRFIPTVGYLEARGQKFFFVLTPSGLMRLRVGDRYEGGVLVERKGGLEVYRCADEGR